MAYVRLSLPETLPEAAHVLVRDGVEPLLQDVHWMLASTFPDRGPREQLQRPVAHLLLAAVSGISARLYWLQEGGGSGRRFKQCLLQFYPWEADALKAISPDEAVNILYDVFRNPLVHNLGFRSSESRVVKIGMVLRGNADAEKLVEELERLPGKPYTKPFLVANNKKYVLWLDPFYWGIRKMVERWADDPEQVAHAITQRST